MTDSEKWDEFYRNRNKRVTPRTPQDKPYNQIIKEWLNLNTYPPEPPSWDNNPSESCPWKVYVDLCRR